VLARRRSGYCRVAEDRYEPLPALPELPGWLWRRTSRGLRIAFGVALLAAVVVVVALVPAIRASKSERTAQERRAAAVDRTAQDRRLQAEQRPRFRRSSSVAPARAGSRAQLAARAGLMDDLTAGILSDARARVRADQLRGPILRVECERFPRTVEGVAPDRDLSQRRGRYACVAITAELQRSAASAGGVLGHPYRALADFHTGRYAFCKISGRPDPTPDPAVTTPRACGG
jgi:hypothetical protein